MGFFPTVISAAEEDELKAAAAALCTALKNSDKVAFEGMLVDDRKNEMQWWWEASGKGKYFATLYDRCEYDHLDPKSTGTNKKVFIQRFNKDGTNWGRPAPVVFKKDAAGVWKIVNYSL